MRRCCISFPTLWVEKIGAEGLESFRLHGETRPFDQRQPTEPEERGHEWFDTRPDYSHLRTKRREKLKKGSREKVVDFSSKRKLSRTGGKGGDRHVRWALWESQNQKNRGQTGKAGWDQERGGNHQPLDRTHFG